VFFLVDFGFYLTVRAGRPHRTEAMFIAGSPWGNSGRNLGSYRVYVSPSLVLCLD
jgi:hypothetical protein